MRAIAITPKQPNSIHLVRLPMPSLAEVPGGRGVLVKVLRVGICGTDREIVAGKYGEAPPGSDFLVLGHENFGVVERVGPEVHEVSPGDSVVAMVRRPGNSIYDVLGMPDMTTDDVYYEHGINLLHGFLTEYYVDTPERLIHVPVGLEHIGVLLEPASIIEKGLDQVYLIQRRLLKWQPHCVAVLGAGSVGLLATLFLRLRGLDVVTMALPEPPYLNSQLVEALGARYLSTRQMSLTEASGHYGPFDLIFEATGYSPLAFEAMEVLGKNGVLVLYSVTGGGRELEVPIDLINHGFVLGNKVMIGTVNANRQHFEEVIRDFALAELQYPGWLSRLLTHHIDAFGDDYHRAFEIHDPDSIKLVVEMARKAEKPG
jgi:threonine dehydrogenase-like Zn-dependent dehydrogenase